MLMVNKNKLNNSDFPTNVSDLTGKTLVRFLGKESAFLNGEFDPEFILRAKSFISWVGENRGISFAVNRIILEKGHTICPQLHEEMYSLLLDSIESQIGFGKAIFNSTMLHMPERYSRLKLSHWIGLGGILGTINTNLRQTALTQSLEAGKINLSHDIATWMESLGESFYIHKALASFDREEINKASLGDSFPVEVHAAMLCKNKAFKQAISIAETKESEQIVRDSIAREIKSKDSSWKGILSHVCNKVSGDDYDSSTIIARYKSIGSVIIDRLQEMDEETRKSELSNDDLRIMGLKLGAQGVINDIESGKHKRKALVFDLCL